jgi:hypothetical protein
VKIKAYKWSFVFFFFFFFYTIKIKEIFERIKDAHITHIWWLLLDAEICPANFRGKNFKLIIGKNGLEVG